MLITGDYSFSQTVENQEKKPAELKAKSETKKQQGEKNPELKAYDSSTATGEKRKKEDRGTPELKAMSNQ